MNLVYIHGANATPESFNYIAEHLNHSGEHVMLSYSSRDGFYYNLQRMIDVLDSLDSDMFLICHSLGGIYALHLYNRFPDRIRGAVTLSTPYGGSSQADYAKYLLPFNMLLRDVCSNCAPILEAQEVRLQIPWCAIITTTGDSIWMSEPNDGVVSIASQRRRTDVEQITVELNHYEIMMCPTVVSTINHRIAQVNDNTN
jgi:pimeloyl-ACP methyl ester carboxylesterase